MSALLAIDVQLLGPTLAIGAAVLLFVAIYLVALAFAAHLDARDLEGAHCLAAAAGSGIRYLEVMPSAVLLLSTPGAGSPVTDAVPAPGDAAEIEVLVEWTDRVLDLAATSHCLPPPRDFATLADVAAMYERGLSAEQAALELARRHDAGAAAAGGDAGGGARTWPLPVLLAVLLLAGLAGVAAAQAEPAEPPRSAAATWCASSGCEIGASVALARRRSVLFPRRFWTIDSLLSADSVGMGFAWELLPAPTVADADGDLPVPRIFVGPAVVMPLRADEAARGRAAIGLYGCVRWAQ